MNRLHFLALAEMHNEVLERWGNTKDALFTEREPKNVVRDASEIHGAIQTFEVQITG